MAGGTLEKGRSPGYFGAETLATLTLNAAQRQAMGLASTTKNKNQIYAPDANGVIHYANIDAIFKAIEKIHLESTDADTPSTLAFIQYLKERRLAEHQATQEETSTTDIPETEIEETAQKFLMNIQQILKDLHRGFLYTDATGSLQKFQPTGVNRDTQRQQFDEQYLQAIKANLEKLSVAEILHVCVAGQQGGLAGDSAYFFSEFAKITDNAVMIRFSGNDTGLTKEQRARLKAIHKGNIIITPENNDQMRIVAGATYEDMAATFKVQAADGSNVEIEAPFEFFTEVILTPGQSPDAVQEQKIMGINLFTRNCINAMKNYAKASDTPENLRSLGGFVDNIYVIKPKTQQWMLKTLSVLFSTAPFLIEELNRFNIDRYEKEYTQRDIDVPVLPSDATPKEAALHFLHLFSEDHIIANQKLVDIIATLESLEQSLNEHEEKLSDQQLQTAQQQLVNCRKALTVHHRKVNINPNNALRLLQEANITVLADSTHALPQRINVERVIAYLTQNNITADDIEFLQKSMEHHLALHGDFSAEDKQLLEDTAKIAKIHFFKQYVARQRQKIANMHEVDNDVLAFLTTLEGLITFDDNVIANINAWLKTDCINNTDKTNGNIISPNSQQIEIAGFSGFENEIRSRVSGLTSKDNAMIVLAGSGNTLNEHWLKLLDALQHLETNPSIFITAACEFDESFMFSLHKVLGKDSEPDDEANLYSAFMASDYVTARTPTLTEEQALAIRALMYTAADMSEYAGKYADDSEMARARSVLVKLDIVISKFDVKAGPPDIGNAIRFKARTEPNDEEMRIANSALKQHAHQDKFLLEHNLQTSIIYALQHAFECQPALVEVMKQRLNLSDEVSLQQVISATLQIHALDYRINNKNLPEIISSLDTLLKALPADDDIPKNVREQNQTARNLLLYSRELLTLHHNYVPSKTNQSPLSSKQYFNGLEHIRKNQKPKPAERFFTRLLFGARANHTLNFKMKINTRQNTAAGNLQRRYVQRKKNKLQVLSDQAKRLAHTDVIATKIGSVALKLYSAISGKSADERKAKKTYEQKAKESYARVGTSAQPSSTRTTGKWDPQQLEKIRSLENLLERLKALEDEIGTKCNDVLINEQTELFILDCQVDETLSIPEKIVALQSRQEKLRGSISRAQQLLDTAAKANPRHRAALTALVKAIESEKTPLITLQQEARDLDAVIQYLQKQTTTKARPKVTSQQQQKLLDQIRVVTSQDANVAATTQLQQLLTKEMTLNIADLLALSEYLPPLQKLIERVENELDDKIGAEATNHVNFTNRYERMFANKSTRKSGQQKGKARPLPTMRTGGAPPVVDPQQGSTRRPVGPVGGKKK